MFKEREYTSGLETCFCHTKKVYIGFKHALLKQAAVLIKIFYLQKSFALVIKEGEVVRWHLGLLIDSM